jgi:alpha-amylase
MTQRACRLALLAVALAALAGCGSSSGNNNNNNDAGNGTYTPGQPLTLTVGAAFPAGTTVRDVSSGTTATVTAQGTVTFTPDSSGLLLLEKDGATPSAFTWANSTVYFLLTDRFFNGDPSNDHGYPARDGGPSDLGGWHGGDWKGVTAKLDYIASLGVTAIWISPIVEQVHGWVGGGTGDFKHFAYAGYWALDFTKLDANWGSEADLQALVDAAHTRGIRVLVDVVMNHPGYATGDDLVEFLPTVFYDGTGNAFKAFVPQGSSGYQGWNNLVNYNSTQWVNWWTPAWIRAGFPGFDPSGSTPETQQLSSLPDFKTESTVAASRPPFFDQIEAAEGTNFVTTPNTTPRQYLVKWHTDWLQQLGFDGFRCDTAKNVELASWKALKDAALPALAAWKTANPTKKLDDSPFWMTGEVFGHGVQKDAYYTDGGFDSLINFDFQRFLLSYLTTSGSLIAAQNDVDQLYSSYAALVSTDPSFNVLSYLSSHDTSLFFASMGYQASLQKQAGTALLLAPGGVQIFYGDESGRKLGPTGSDPTQGTRSDMNWGSMDADILAHWQKVGSFRKRHAAVGGGAHQKIQSPSNVYAFSRILSSGNDAVVVAITPTP